MDSSSVEQQEPLNADPQHSKHRREVFSVTRGKSTARVFATGEGFTLTIESESLDKSEAKCTNWFGREANAWIKNNIDLQFPLIENVDKHDGGYDPQFSLVPVREFESGNCAVRVWVALDRDCQSCELRCFFGRKSLDELVDRQDYEALTSKVKSLSAGDIMKCLEENPRNGLEPW